MVDLSKYRDRILAAKEKVYNAPAEDHSSMFLDMLFLNGYKTGNIAHGILTRIADHEDKGIKKSGWYIYYQNETVSVGIYGSWKRPEEKNIWYSKDAKYLAVHEQNEVTAQIQAAQERQKKERLVINEEAAVSASKLFDKLPRATDDNQYLTRKQVKAFPHLRVQGEDLLIPVMCDGVITSMQTIFPGGGKRFMTGGKTKGCYFIIDGNDSIVYVAEGYATGASIAMASGNKVYIAFSAHNLYETTATASKDHGKVIVCADNDATCKAKCEQIKNESIFPPAEHNDFNDWWVDDKQAMMTFFTMNSEVKNVVEEVESPHNFKPSGVIADIIDYYNATAKRDQPLFAIQCAIATCSVILARNFETNLDNRTSLFLMNVAKSATGKEHAKTICEKILEATDNEYLISGDGYTSSSGVISACHDKPRHITIIDEFSKYLQACKNKNSGGHMAEANSTLMQAITRLSRVLRPKNRANFGLTATQKKEVQNQYVICPAITMLTMTTPDDFFETIDASAIKDGFINRFIICISDMQRTLPKRNEPMPVPESVIDWGRHIKARRGASDESPVITPNMITIPFSRECDAIHDEYEYHCMLIANKADECGMSAISGRSPEMALRLSLIIALSENPNAKQIEVRHLEQAINWVKFNMDRLVKELKMNISASDHEASKKEILKALRELGGIPKSNMFKRPPFSKYKKKDLDSLLEELEEAELIVKEIEQREGAGNRKTIWKAV